VLGQVRIRVGERDVDTTVFLIDRVSRQGTAIGRVRLSVCLFPLYLNQLTSDVESVCVHTGDDFSSQVIEHRGDIVYDRGSVSG